MQEYKFHAFITVQETLMFTINCKATASDNRTQQEKARIFFCIDE